MAWLAGWSYRKTVTITGQSGAGTDYQVDFSIGDASGGDFHVENHCTSFPNDIQVTDNDQTTPIDYWIEDLTVDPISMWVEVADDLGSNVDVCIYYGKSGESSASNGSNTFLFFDGFASDIAGWSCTSGTFTWDNGRLKGTGDGSGEDKAIKSISTSSLYVFEGEVEKAETNKNAYVVLNYTSSNRLGFKLGDDGYVYYLNASDYQKSSEKYSASTKYKFKMIVHESTNTADYYFNGVELATGQGYYSSSEDPNEIQMSFYLSTSTMYFDDLFTRKYNSPEPAFSNAGAEETPSIGHPTMARWHGIPGMNYTGRAGVGW